MAADREQSSRKLGSSSKNQDGSKAEMGLAGAYRQHLQLFLQVRLTVVQSFEFVSNCFKRHLIFWGAPLSGSSRQEMR